MNSFICNGYTFTYIVRYTTKNRIYIRIKDNNLVVSAPRFTSNKTIEKVIEKNCEILKKQFDEVSKKQIIHLNGIALVPNFIYGEANKVVVSNEEITIVSKSKNEESFKRLLYDYFKQIVMEQTSLIINDAKRDFNNIIFPDIKFRYLKSMFGNYNRKKHQICLSTMLARYDYRFIKSVLYHELTHVVVFNHSKEFYQLYEKKFPNARMVQRQLKKIKYYDYL